MTRLRRLLRGCNRRRLHLGFLFGLFFERFGVELLGVIGVHRGIGKRNAMHRFVVEGDARLGQSSHCRL